MLMERAIHADLLEWKNSSNRKPLLLEGVRQCGKTYVLKEFGERNYEDTAYFTFENNPDFCDIFRTDLDPKRIINRLNLLRKRNIEPGKTLIILDEIQFCNRALTSLKFFCEDAPEYHITCAGSLLGVMLSKPYSFPVGKVNRLSMGPMNFKEFLLANSENTLVEHIDNSDPTEALPKPVVNKLNTYLDYYFMVGGMPAAVASWIAKADIREVEKILDDIIKDYRADFSKHAPESLPKLTLIWNSLPDQLAKDNKKFIFSHVKTGARAKDLEDALEWLINAGLVYKVRKADPPKVPLSTFADNTNFKIYLADIGILRRMAKVPSAFLFDTNGGYSLFRGAVAENYVLNELISSTWDVPYYWRSGGTAEVDFIAQIEGVAVPIEVKAGSSKSKSLAEFIKRYRPKVAVTISAESGGNGGAVHIPLYAAWKIADYVRERAGGGEPPLSLK
ncbi:MAG: ATP-binding protein [Candidatus Methanoplasma sp.]|jgi:predicted AAA+ superfamily ATPase|nr:ATP-binding protein [Candidatus Methanoplasma sp.]